jgi:hypothetical protein
MPKNYRGALSAQRNPMGFCVVCLNESMHYSCVKTNNYAFGICHDTQQNFRWFKGNIALMLRVARPLPRKRVLDTIARFLTLRLVLMQQGHKLRARCLLLG